MNRQTSLRKWLILTLTLTLFIWSIGCSGSQVKYQQPNLGEAAVLHTELLPRPELEAFTPDEMKAIPRTAHGKILKFLAAVWGYEDVADAAVKAHQDYEKSLFSGQEKKK